MAPALEPVFAKLWAAYSRHGLTARTVTVKIKYADFRQATRSRTLPAPVATREDLHQVSIGLVRSVFPPETGIRLVGVTLSSFAQAEKPDPQQLGLAL